MSRFGVLTAGLLLFAACDDEEKAATAGKIDALDARVAELERKGTDSGKALESLAPLPNALEQAQQSLATMKAEQATLVARLARAEEKLAALQAHVDAGTAVTPKVEAETETLTGVGAGKLAIGVTECDEFMAKYASCIEKMPESVRKSMIDALQQMSETWKKVADGPGRKALAEACKTADESSKKAFESMGCKW